MIEKSRYRSVAHLLPVLAPVIIPAASFDSPGWTNTIIAALMGFAIIVPLTLSALVITLCSKKGANGFVKMFLAGMVMSFAGMFLEIFLLSLAGRAQAAELREQLAPRIPYTWLAMMFLCGVLWQIYIGFDSGYREREHRKAPLNKKQDDEPPAAPDDMSPEPEEKNEDE